MAIALKSAPNGLVGFVETLVDLLVDGGQLDVSFSASDHADMEPRFLRYP